MVCSWLEGEFGGEREKDRKGHAWQGRVGWIFSEGGLVLQCWEVGNVYGGVGSDEPGWGQRRQCYERGS